MPEVAIDPLDQPRTTDPVARLVARLLDRLHLCRCGATPHVLLLRGFDGASRERAGRVRREVRAAMGPGKVDIDTRPAPLEAPVFRAPTDLEHLCAVIDLSAGPSAVATLAWTWRPNQPERGVLAVTLDGLPEVVLGPGQTLDVRPGEQLLDVEVRTEVGVAGRVAHTGADSWQGVAHGVHVRVLDGPYLLHRDEIHVRDAPADAAFSCALGTARLVS